MGTRLTFSRDNHCKLPLFTLFCNLKLFTNIILELSLKNAWLPAIFFLDLYGTC